MQGSEFARVGRPLDRLSPQALFRGLSMGAGGGQWTVLLLASQHPQGLRERGEVFLSGDQRQLPVLPKGRWWHLGLTGTRLAFGKGT